MEGFFVGYFHKSIIAKMGFSITDFLFPSRCVSCREFGAYICKKCFLDMEFIEKPICPVCQRQAVGGRAHPGCRSRYRLDGLIVVCKYKGPVKLAILKVKYKWIYDIEKVFVDLFLENFWRFEFPHDLILVPVPLHPKRKRWRGFNQAEILARTLAKSFDVPFSDCMIRIRETAAQVGLKRDKRQENVKGAFSIKMDVDPKTVDGKKFLLVDDVYTSGATMAECCRVLKKAGAGEVWGMAVALG